MGAANSLLLFSDVEEEEKRSRGSIMLFAAMGTGHQKLMWVRKGHVNSKPVDSSGKNDEFCIKNEEFVSKTRNLYQKRGILYKKNEGFCIQK